MEHTIDIILPCYNPHNNWDNNVIESFNKLADVDRSWKLNLIIANDGSNKGIDSDNIKNIKANIPNFTWISYDVNKGKGYALRKGVQISTSDYIILTDIDFPYTHESVVGLIRELIKNDSDVLAGERDSRYYEQTPVIRKNISIFLKFIVKKLLKIPVSDTQCGLKGFKNEVKDTFLSTKINRYLYDIEFLWLAARKHRVASIPVELKENIVFSKMDTKILFNEGINFIKFLTKTILSK